MDKIITIPNEILIDLKVLAAKSNVTLKKYIETQLIILVEKDKKKEARCQK